MSVVKAPHVLIVSNHWGAKNLSPSAGIFVDRQIVSLEGVGVKISTFDIGLSHSPIGLIKKWLELRKLVRMLNPDLLHGRYGTIVGFVTAFVGKPSVISFCGGDLLLGASIPLFRQRVGVLLSNLAALRAKRLICVSEELKEALWWRKSRTIVIPDGVDLDLFSPAGQDTARRELGWNPNNPIVLLNVRNDPKAKGLDLAKAAIRQAQLRIPDVELCVIENIAPDRMPLHYQAADALLCLSLSEGSPNVVKEALACNLPVISTRVGDVAERLAGVQPSAVVERDVAAIAEAMVQILQHRKRSNGREHVCSLSLNNIAQRIVDVYKTALHKESNGNMGVSIPRPEEPRVVPITNDQMLKDVAGIHLEAFAGYLNAQFGRGYAKAFVRWFSTSKGAIAIAAVDSNRNVIGYALGAPVGYGRTLNRELFWGVAGRIIVRPWLFLNPQLWKVLIARVKILLGFTQTESDVFALPEPTMSLVAIGVVQAQRRGKVGRRLMEAFEARARESQMRSAILSVYKNREAARRFYEKCGWLPDGAQAGGGTVMRYFKMLQSVGTRSIDSTN